VPINGHSLISREHYWQLRAFLRGIERRIDAGLKPDVGSVASVFISRWTLRSWQGSRRLARSLGIAIAKRTYKACRTLLSSPRWQRVYNAGARPQRLLWPARGLRTQRPPNPVHQGLAAPFTVNTMPEGP